jgi:hypothetical protein
MPHQLSDFCFFHIHICEFGEESGGRLARSPLWRVTPFQQSIGVELLFWSRQHEGVRSRVSTLESNACLNRE